jgi:hypothetical protein
MKPDDLRSRIGPKTWWWLEAPGSVEMSSPRRSWRSAESAA